MSRRNHQLLVSTAAHLPAALSAARLQLSTGAALTWLVEVAADTDPDLATELLRLKNQYMARCCLLLITRDEPQPYGVLHGPLDAAKLAQTAGTLFDPASITQTVIYAPTAVFDDLVPVAQAAGLPAPEQRALDEAEAATPPPVRADTPSERTADGRGNQPPPAGAQVTVILQGRKRVFEVEDPESTLLDAAEDAGLELPWSCRGGICSTCRARVTEGDVELLENYALEDWELDAGFTLVCQAVARSAAVRLDYDDV